MVAGAETIYNWNCITKEKTLYYWYFFKIKIEQPKVLSVSQFSLLKRLCHIKCVSCKRKRKIDFTNTYFYYHSDCFLLTYEVIPPPFGQCFGLNFVLQSI